MITFTIQQLEYWTGLKSHTLRMWEQRYGAFTPQRQERRHRLYSPHDIQRALCLALLTRQQAAVAPFVNQSLPELLIQAEPLLQADQFFEQQLIGLLLAIAQDDTHQFEQRLLASWQQVGGFTTLRELILPLTQRMRQVGATSQATLDEWTPWWTILEQHLLRSIEQLPPAWLTSTNYLLIELQPKGVQLPFHMAHYLLLSQGYLTVTIAANDSYVTLYQAIQRHQPQYVLVFMEHWPAPHQVQTYVNELALICLDTRLWLTGDRIIGQDILLPNGVNILTRLENLPLLTSEYDA